MKRIIAIVLAGVSPMMALAQNTYNPSLGINGLFGLIGTWVKLALPLLISVAVVWFIWEVFQYTIAGEEEKKAKAKEGMIYGIIGIFIMVSVWGLVGILQSTFGTSGSTVNIGNQLPIGQL